MPRGQVNGATDFDELVNIAPKRSVAALAKIVADSKADVGDADSCLQAVIEAGVLPWEVSHAPGFWLDVRIEAQNLRAMRYWINRCKPPLAS